MNLRIRDKSYIILQIEDQIHLLDKTDMNQKLLDHISNYEPEYKNELEVPARLDDNGARLDKCESPNPEMKIFLDEVKELRSEQKEIAQDYCDLRIKIE